MSYLLLLVVGNSGDSGQDVPGQQLEGCAAPRRHVRDGTGLAEFFERGDGISSADDRDGTLLGAGIKGLDLEDSHGSIENNLGAPCESLLEEGRRLGTNIQAHPSIGDTTA